MSLIREPGSCLGPAWDLLGLSKVKLVISVSNKPRHPPQVWEMNRKINTLKVSSTWDFTHSKLNPAAPHRPQL